MVRIRAAVSCGGENASAPAGCAVATAARTIHVAQSIKKYPIEGIFLLTEKHLLNGEDSDSN